MNQTPATADDRHRALSLYAMAARDMGAFLQGVREKTTTIPCLELLLVMCEIRQGRKIDADLNKKIAPLLRRELESRTQAAQVSVDDIPPDESGLHPVIR